MRGWAIYIKPRKGKGSTLYAYSVFGVETVQQAIDVLRALDLAALWSPDLFEAVCLPVLRNEIHELRQGLSD